MKRIAAILTMTILLLFSGCNTSNIKIKQQESPHVYWKDIEVTVIDIDTKAWYAKTHWFEVQITVESEEYGLTESFTIKKGGSKPSQWDYEEGQVVTAELYSWVMDSTGQVVKREINQVY